jgi:uncharacterized protein (DUF427 family)
MTRETKIPGPDHPITIEPSADRVIVRAGGATLAESTATLLLQEANYPAVRYIPLTDVDETLLAPSDTSTYCPYKGDASYRSITSDPDRGEDAVWFYPEPSEAVQEIRDHVAFYADRVEITVEAA